VAIVIPSVSKITKFPKRKRYMRTPATPIAIPASRLTSLALFPFVMETKMGKERSGSRMMKRARVV